VTRWKVVLRPAAKKQYRLLEEGPKRDAAELIEDLAEDPTRIPGAIPMKGYANAYRARFHHQQYRMVYEIFKGSRTVVISRMRPRPAACQGMKKPGRPKPKSGK
jgi:mRNA-degrading endonuclease RelE of RelBE toxin-antitoxin system